MSDETAPAAGVDWADVRRRVAAVGAALAAGGETTAERNRDLLEARAVRLARVEEREDADESIEMIVFTRGGESYAIESRYVMEVRPLGMVTPLPGTDAGVVGVTAWRGQSLVVHELAPAAGADVDQWLVSLGEDRAAFGLVVDAAPELRQVPAEAIATPPAELIRDRVWLSGITDHALMIIDGPDLIRIHSEGSAS